MSAVSIDQAFTLALQHQSAGRKSEAEVIYRQILAHDPNYIDALHNLGIIALQAGHGPAALELVTRAHAANPQSAAIANTLASAHLLVKQPDQAEKFYRRAIELDPRYPQPLVNLGNLLRAKNQFKEAEDVYRRALAIDPHYADAACQLAAALLNQGRWADAEEACHRALALRPDLALAHQNLGYALHHLGRDPDAIICLQNAVSLNPQLPQALLALGSLLHAVGKDSEAESALRRAVAQEPNSAAAHMELGLVFIGQGHLLSAMSEYRAAIAADPKLAMPRHFLALGLAACGSIPESLEMERKALELAPDNVAVDSSLLYLEHFDDGPDAQTRFGHHLAWAQRRSDPLRSQIRPHANDRDPDRPLRVGYVSRDFVQHPVSTFILPILRNIDRSQFDLTLYADIRRPDEVTPLVKAAAPRWKDVFGTADTQLAELIRGDQIDILVDLAGHTAENRLLMFAHKPAPVQVTHFGYPDTTGMTQMDYRITDALADPVGSSEQFYTEKLIRLPCLGWLYGTPDDAPDVGPLPARSSGRITFGAFNGFAKVGPKVFALWARILQAVPNSRLFLLTYTGQVAPRVDEYCAEHGLARDRILTVGRAPRTKYLELHNTVDIALDPFPYNGAITTSDALWMGVPVASLEGDRYVSRQGLAVLSNVGLPELVGKTPDDYVKIAVELANDLPRLSALRAGLRKRLRQSPLGDAPQFVANLQIAYRQMWRQWATGV